MAEHRRPIRFPSIPVRHLPAMARRQFMAIPAQRRLIGGVVGGALAAAALGAPATATLVANGPEKSSTVTAADRSTTPDRASRDQARTAPVTPAPVTPAPTTSAPATTAPAPAPVAPAPALPATVADLDKAQTANAIAIVKTGHDMGVSERGQIIAVATALQESQLYNLDVAVDHDSLGLFQQRPSSGWGTPAQLTDPAYAARAFYQGLLQDTGDWGCLTCAAQRVQVSAYPDAYAKHEGHATTIVTSINAALGR